jgi:hypothetical protein
MDESENDQEANAGESAQPEGHANTENIKTPELKLDVGQLAALGVAVAVGISVLMDKTEVRKVCSKVLQDPVVRDAGQALCRQIAASWRRHGGVTVLASALLR